MATVLTTPREIGRRIAAYISALQANVSELNGYDSLYRRELNDGTTPLDVKALIDPLMVNVNTTIDSISTNLAALTYKLATRWQAGSPPGVGWLRSGYRNDTTFATSGGAVQGLQMILYNDVGPNIDLFYKTTGAVTTYAVKANDVISVQNCSRAANNGRYTIKYDVMPKADNTTYGVGAISTWTESVGTEWTPATGVWSSAAGGTGTLTEGLLACSATGAVTVQFTVAYGSGTTTLTATIGGDYYFSKVFSSAADSGTYSFTSNASGVTPTLTVTATSAGASSLTLSNPFVYGAPVLFTVEEFDADVGTGEDDQTIVTLEQTAA